MTDRAHHQVGEGPTVNLGRWQVGVLRLLAVSERGEMDVGELIRECPAMSESAAYGAVERLGERGLIDVAGSRGKRRTYKLTERGSEAVDQLNRPTKECRECGVTKALDRFPRSPRTRDKRRGECRECFQAKVASDPLRRKARSAVQNALRRGRLVRPSACSQCGREGYVEGHHADYARSEDVVWLCKPCHSQADRVRREAEVAHV